MEWIVFQSANSELAPLNYYNSIKIAYLLNSNVISVGLDETSYFFCELGEKMSINFKAEHLMAENSSNPRDYEIFATSREALKKFDKIKHKSSKLIIANAKMKKTIENAFTSNQKRKYDIYSQIFHLSILKNILDNQIFHFYTIKDFNLTDVTNNSEFFFQLLQLNFADTKKVKPIFFLSNLKKDGSTIEVNFLNAMDKKAEDKNNFYGEVSYTFPLLDSLSSRELFSLRKELEKPTSNFREKIEEWSSICYTNPNTNLGLDYFRKEMQPFLQSTTNEMLENPFLKNVSSLTNKHLETQIIIGEAPIEKIWELFLDTNCITPEVFENLIKLVGTQFPKFEGRWPVVFFKSTEEAKKYMIEERQNDGVQSVRKSISLD